MSIATPYKPPISYGSPRSSPFRRPESPASPSPLRNSTTPTTSPTKAMGTPSKLNSSKSPNSDAETWTPRGLVASIPPPREPEQSPTKNAHSAPRMGSLVQTSRPASADMNAVSKLPPAQVRELREGFQLLDRDGDGVVGRDDIADMLTQLGLPASASDVAAFFPPSTAQTLTLPTFLTQISTTLAALSPQSELLSAFSAFDEDDNGQIDLAELRDALLHTAPEPGEKPLTAHEIDKIMGGFSGRRAFAKGMTTSNRGEVFRYHEFVAAVTGSANGRGAKEDSE